MVKNKNFLLLSIIFLGIIGLDYVSAWELSGNVYDINDNLLYNATINVTIRNQNFNVVGYNSTYTNASGWFNLSVSDNANWMYQPVIKHLINNKTDGSTAIDFIGQSLPAFPYRELSNGLSTNFYLKEAGTINITAVNGTGAVKTFQYQVKDTSLGYPIAESWGYVSEAIIQVPRARNYSIMIYPQQSLPVSFDWSNFSSAVSYNFTVGNWSQYINTTYTVQKQFNCTETLTIVDGFIVNSTNNILTWNEFTIIPFLLEPGNMVYLGDNAAMPYNMSAWNATPYSDKYSLASGNYNITLPAPAESATYILFATARSGTNYYGGYRNLTLTYGNLTVSSFNFTMYPLMSTDWATATGNFTMNDATNWNALNVSSAKQLFRLINSTNSTLSAVSAHLEVTVDYSSYGAVEFTFMTDISQSGTSLFYLPLLNVTGIKEMNIFSMNYAPKRVSTKTAAEIIADPNITLVTFNPQTIGGTTGASISIAIYKSNSTCDLPGNENQCAITSSSNMATFKPLSAVAGGGKISFRMGISNVLVHYVNVDMIASGPPDALFDSNSDVTESTSGGFGKALRFGSNGPRIYDYVLISIPYTEGSSSTTGLNENAGVNISLPVFYNENWAVVWNTSVNGTNGTALAANDSHYSTYKSDWEKLLNPVNCTRNTTEFNATTPCYIDTTNNRIWVRLPHFSGTGPSVSGGVVTATTSPSSTGSSSSGGTTAGSTAGGYIRDIDITNGESVYLGTTDNGKFVLKEVTHTIDIKQVTNTSVKLEIRSTPIILTFGIGDRKNVDVDGNGKDDLFIRLDDIVGGKAKLYLKEIKEEEGVVEEEKGEEITGEAVEKGVEKELEKGKISYKKVWIVIGIFILVICCGGALWYYKKERSYYKTIKK